jgi:radical SAM protein with 4Fe4S-binding SPASM domain
VVNSPFFIDWVITGKCNLSCRHCRGTSEGELSPKRALELVDEIAKLKPKWLIIEGGEPLLRPDIFGILEKINQAGLDVYVITNGMLINSDIMARLCGLNARVMISIDGANKATYESIRHGASYEKVLGSAQKCAESGILTAINFTILKMNYGEIPAIMKLAASLGTVKVNLIGLKPCHNYREELLTSREYARAIKLTCDAAKETGVEFFFDEPFFWPAVKKWGLEVTAPGSNAGIVVPSKNACIFGEYLFIEPSGNVKPCSFAQLVLGNVNLKSLEAIWHEALDSPLLKSIKDLDNRSGECRSCIYLHECSGCRSRTFNLTSDWLTSDPVCPLQDGGTRA